MAPGWLVSFLIWVVHSLGVRYPRILQEYLLSTDTLSEKGSQELSLIFMILMISAFFLFFVEKTFQSLGPVIVQVARFSFWFLFLNLSFLILFLFLLSNFLLSKEEKFTHMLRNSQVMEEYIVECVRSGTKRVLLWLLSQLE